jgi:H+/Cl- antiporter ClcA
LNTKIKEKIKWILLSAGSGVLSGVAAAVFLYSLSWATQTRDLNPSVIWLLPVAGFLIGWVYHVYGKDSARGNNLILDEIHDPQKTIPLRMAPLVLGGTLITHFFGGSAGREGTAVQMGASLSDQLSHFFKMAKEERKILLVAGAGAGFGAAIGTPLAGVVFGMEIINVGKLQLFAWLECLVASYVGYYTVVALGAPHSHYPLFDVGGFNFKTLFFVLIAGVIFGLTARAFAKITHTVENLCSRFIKYAPLKPFIGGLLLVGLYYIEGSYKYVGLGIPMIQQALEVPSSFIEPVYKSFFTALTIGSGFKGGEFIPLVFIGTTLGSALSVILPISFKLLAALGFAAVFAGAANALIACSFMAIEIFGYAIAPYAFAACFMSYYFSGYHAIYKSQKIENKKHQRVLGLFKKVF